MSNNEEKKGFGPALAALILAIIGFVITGIVALVFSGLQSMMEEILAETISAELGSFAVSNAEELAIVDGVKLGMKIAFGGVYFSGGLFMLIAFICDIVAICKYYGNKSETKAASTIVLAYIALAFLIASVAIAVMGCMEFAAIVDKVMAPYYA